ncbi:hypothetical protein [Nitrosopumilus sp.]|uniref:hypothetical protein n=1 Tax=Nitrosopumilus sp. TaxID=2024843 RepID=UPI003D0FD0F2
MSNDTFGGASKTDIALATTIGVFLLLGSITGFGFYQCYTDSTIACPAMGQDHFDRAFDLILYLGMAGAILIGLRLRQNGNNVIPPSIVINNASGGIVNTSDLTKPG